VGISVLPNFIVLEGIDGAGTTTQLELLRTACRTHGVRCVTTSEPTEGPIGKLIRHYLSGAEPVQPRTLALLFAADRREHLHRPEDGIVRLTERGSYVISDRYLFSSLAYQSTECGFEYVLGLNNDFPLPEHLVYVDVPVELGLKRLEGRAMREITETEEIQRNVQALYRKTIERFSDSGMKIHVIDGNRSADEIASEIWSRLALVPIQET
jgi:dTMP kinase